MDRLSIGPLLLAMREQFPDAPPSRESSGEAKLEALLAESWVSAPATRAALSDFLSSVQRWPTSKQLEAALRSTKPTIRLADHDAAVAACIARFGHDFLALGAIPWSAPCEACAADDAWTTLGGSLDEELLRHLHCSELDPTFLSISTPSEQFGALYLGWTFATFVHAIDYARGHAPDGTPMERPEFYHPLRARIGPGAFRARSAEVAERLRPRMRGLLDRFLGRTKKVVAACGHCGDRGTVPEYVEEFDGRIDPSRVQRFVPCLYCQGYSLEAVL